MPRGGGLGVLAGAAAGLLAAVPAWDRRWTALVAGAGALAAIGLWDDARRLSPFARLAFQVAVATATVVAVGGLSRLPLPPGLDAPLGELGNPLAVVWIVALVNFYNFLDGIDGLAALQAVVTGAGLALAGWDPFAAVLGAVLAAACCGFLVHNWSPARIFLGDVGSGSLGFCFAAAALLAPPERRPHAVLFVAVSLFLFLADASYTLLARIVRGEPFYEAHREHAYQRIVAGGRSHGAVTGTLGVAGAWLTALALVWWRSRLPASAWAALACGVVVFAAELIWARRATAAVPAEAGVVRGVGA